MFIQQIDRLNYYYSDNLLQRKLESLTQKQPLQKRNQRSLIRFTGDRRSFASFRIILSIIFNWLTLSLRNTGTISIYGVVSRSLFLEPQFVSKATSLETGRLFIFVTRLQV